MSPTNKVIKKLNFILKVNRSLLAIYRFNYDYEIMISIFVDMIGIIPVKLERM